MGVSNFFSVYKGALRLRSTSECGFAIKANTSEHMNAAKVRLKYTSKMDTL